MAIDRHEIIKTHCQQMRVNETLRKVKYSWQFGWFLLVKGISVLDLLWEILFVKYSHLEGKRAEG
jgi:hypothetical protein